MRKILLTTFIGLVSIGLVYGVAYAAVTGVCSYCHTMHNSQDGTAMATFGTDNWTATGNPNNALTRGSCLGCHAQGGTAEIVTNIPQIYHTGDDDLAGGNFAYIPNHKARVTGSQSSVGHNVIELGYDETTLTAPPGDIFGTGITNANFTCAGQFGCHGDRTVSGNFAAISGAHHQGISGACDTANTVANSYRFLKGVRGFEYIDVGAVDPDDYRWQNIDKDYHNEYYGVTNPGDTGTEVEPANNTISGFCAECHGDFHGTPDIGGNIYSPFTRHPTDIVLKGTGEYASYTTYSTEAPIARQVIPTEPSPIVTPGSDIIMCLSCHGAHATAYEDILKWDYTGMVAGTPSSDTGCFTCHTLKND